MNGLTLFFPPAQTVTAWLKFQFFNNGWFAIGMFLAGVFAFDLLFYKIDDESDWIEKLQKPFARLHNALIALKYPLLIDLSLIFISTLVSRLIFSTPLFSSLLASFFYITSHYLLLKKPLFDFEFYH